MAVLWSPNLVNNGSAETASITMWTKTGSLSIASGGTFGSSYYSLGAVSTMSQTISPVKSPQTENIRIGADVYVSSPTTLADVYLTATVRYSGGKYDEYVFPFNNAVYDKVAGTVGGNVYFWASIDVELPINVDLVLSSYTLLFTNNNTTNSIGIDDIKFQEDQGLQGGTASTPADGSVTEVKIADDAVSSVKIKNAAITNAKIQDLSVDTAKIKDASITNAKIGLLAVDTANIKDAAITNAKIGNLAVDTAQIKDAAITNAKILDATITYAKIGLLQVGTAHIQDAAIETAKIKDATITSAKIGVGEILTANIGDAQITTAKIGLGQITTALLGTAVVDTAQIKNLAITDALIATGISAGKITTGTLDASKVNVTNLVADNIVTGTITIASANLFKNTDFSAIPSTVVAPLAATVFTTGGPNDGKYIQGNISSATTEKYMYLDRVSLSNSKNVTVTAWVKNDAGVTSDIFLLTAKSVDGVGAANASGTWGYDYTHVVQSGTGTAGTWTKVVQTFALASDVKSGYIRLDHNGQVGNVRFAYIMVQYGSLATEWNPHTNELLAAKGITNLQIGDSAVDNRVIQANTITGDRLIADSITGRELAVGSIIANDGIISNLAIGTAQIIDAAITTAKIGDLQVTNAKILDATITSAKIASLDANKINVSDFTNLFELDEVANPGSYTTVTVNNLKYFKIGQVAYSSLVLSTTPKLEFKLNDEYYVSFEGYKEAAIAGNINCIIRYYYSDATWTNAGTVSIPFTTTSSLLSGACKITAAPTLGKTISRIDFFMEKDNTATGYYYMRNIELRKKYAGSLIVDGTIDAYHIKANSITADRIKTGELIVGTNVSMGPNAYLSWNNITSPPAIPNGTYIDATGVYTGTVQANKIIGTKISGITIESIGTANSVTIQDGKVISNDSGTGSGGTINFESLLDTGRVIARQPNTTSVEIIPSAITFWQLGANNAKVDSASINFSINSNLMTMSFTPDVLNITGISKVDFTGSTVLGLNAIAKFG